jgi:NAD(P)-dependent dehydrogenase (short-subunit alcohol dehydrogenase family)
MTSTLFNLSGKTALVTGGNGGIGLGMAKALAGAGADIARMPQRLKTLKLLEMANTKRGKLMFPMKRPLMMLSKQPYRALAALIRSLQMRVLVGSPSHLTKWIQKISRILWRLMLKVFSLHSEQQPDTW